MIYIIETIYLLIGVIYAIYDWKYNTKKIYEKTVEVEDSMLGIYWVTTIIFWPVVFLCKILTKLLTKFFTKN